MVVRCIFPPIPLLLGAGGDGRRRRGRRRGGRFGRAGRCGGRQSCRGHGFEGRREGRERGEGRRRDEGCGLCFFELQVENGSFSQLLRIYFFVVPFETAFREIKSNNLRCAISGSLGV